LNHKLVLIIDMGLKCFKTMPILFEKSLKLLASLSLFANFDRILSTSLETFKVKLNQYACIFRDILGATPPPSQTVISVIGEQIERIMASSNLKVSDVISSSLIVLLSQSKLLQGNPVCLGLLNFGILKDLQTVEFCLNIIVSQY